MSKFIKFILILCCIIVISCECNTYNSSPVVSPESSSEKVIIKDDYNDYVYTKIVIENHEYYFRSWAAYHGSDLVHNPNCSTCNNKENI